MRRALLLLVLAGPAIARPQTTAVTFTPDALIGGEECATGGETFTATWASGIAGGVFDVYISTTRPTSETPPRCAVDAELVLDDEPATTGQTLVVELDARATVLAVGLTCDETALKTIYVCIEHFAEAGDTEPDALASGTVQLDVRKPAQPTGVRTEPGEEALHVFWTAGPKEPVEAVRWLVKATGPAEDPDTRQRETNVAPRDGFRFGGLRNGLAYSVTVTGISQSGTLGVESAAASGTPTEVLDFWELYKDRNGREQGGCASAPGGLLAAAGLVALLARMRRRR
jgi:hypothetical protein